MAQLQGAGCCTDFLGLLCKVPQPEWLWTMEMCCLAVLEAGSPRCRCWQDHVPSEGPREASLLAASGFLQLWSSLTCGCIVPVSVSPFTCLLPCVSLSTFLSTYKDTHYIGSRASPAPI